jgi:MFS superfamily sulfate permease-like transporter
VKLENEVASDALGGDGKTRDNSANSRSAYLGQLWERFLSFNQVIDHRFEDLNRANLWTTTYRDLSAGLIVALTAIPMAMGFAIAMGLRPEQGIVAGALACIVGRTWGGSKYQVYGPTAAFIPVIAGLMFKYGHHSTGGNFAEGHGLLVLCSILAGVILLFMGLFGLGKYVKCVPNSIVVGFTVGIAVVIGLSNIGEVLGLQHEIRGEFFEKVRLILGHIQEFNGYSFFLAMLTFLLVRKLLKLSIFIPAPLLALVLCTLLTETVFFDKGIADVGEKFGSIPSNFFVFTPPVLPAITPQLTLDVVYFVLAILFVSSVESLLCSSMADRLAGNKKTPFNPDKELWGQGLVQIIVPMVNGFPCTGALARTATSIKAGAVTPLAGYFKGVLKIALAVFLAPWLQMVPMACIGGILLWVATNMVKPAEVKEVWRSGPFHAFLMIYTAIMVPVTDFLTGVLSAIVIFAVGKQIIERKGRAAQTVNPAQGTDEKALMERLSLGGASGSVQLVEQRVTVDCSESQ